ncbi:rhodanese-like domain-containing protein [Spiroplasma endosymbiont of Diplazon laetatorius]|uniref:rhodanese-like domain-containing protein n=1 Tax=Spiroplasma endosymbiont of Diplazon laetatorius TaxID=3066322 RepID=UPI0030CEFEAC
MQWLDYVFKFIERIFRTNAFKARYKTKNSKKLAHILKSKKWQVVDIRNSLAYGENHLQGTINIPVTTFNFKYFKMLDKKNKILIIDEDSRSHLSIYKSLKVKGFKVYILYDGYKNIRNNPDFDKLTKVVLY